MPKVTHLVRGEAGVQAQWVQSCTLTLSAACSGKGVTAGPGKLKGIGTDRVYGRENSERHRSENKSVWGPKDHPWV